MSLRLSFLAAALLLFSTGCNYHPVGSAAHLPSTVHTLAVSSFQNHTQSYHTQAVFTQAVIREFISRTPYRIIAGEDPDADATLNGTITRFDIVPLTYDNITGQTSSYLVTITASIELKDRDGRVLFRNPSYLFRQQYEQTQDLASFIQEDSAATHRLASDFAGAVVADIVESF